jgi:hypothetical protein
MSVNFCARAISERLEACLRTEPWIATALATEHEAIDFNRATYVTQLEAKSRSRPPPASALARVDRVEAEHERCWKDLRERGIEHRDVDDTLELHRAYNGLSWGWAGTAAARLLFEEDGGLQMDEDVGYGPARLLSNGDICSTIAEIEKVDIAAFATRYRAGYASAPGGTPTASLLAEYEDFAHVIPAFHRLVAYLRDARIASRALLVWFE